MTETTVLDPPTKDDNEAPYGRDENGTPLDKTGAPAPYGLKKDGTAAKKRGRQAGSSNSSSKPRTSRKAPTYAEGLNQLVQLLGAVPYAAGIATQNDSLLADSWAIQNHGPNIANAVAEMAEQNEAIAKVCDRITRSTPYAALTAAVVPLIAQIAVNHGVVPAGFMGSVDPRLIAHHMKESHNAAQQSSNGTEPTS